MGCNMLSFNSSNYLDPEFRFLINISFFSAFVSPEHYLSTIKLLTIVQHYNKPTNKFQITHFHYIQSNIISISKKMQYMIPSILIWIFNLNPKIQCIYIRILYLQSNELSSAQSNRLFNKISMFLLLIAINPVEW